MNETSQARIIDGAKIAKKIRDKLKKQVSNLVQKPGLAIILVGSDPASYVYVGLKEQAAKEIGICFEKDYYQTSISQDVILHKISELNSRPDINGILVQFPLPKGFDENKIVQAINQEKDVDGFHPKNIANLLLGRPVIIPGLALGVVELLKSTKEKLKGKNAVVIAKGNVFSQPVSYLLKQNGLKVTITNPDSDKCLEITKQADVIIVAVGKAKFLIADMVKPGAIVIDVGYNRINNKAIGDVDFEPVSQKASWITPVPGGVGPMTVAMLLNNVLQAFQIQTEK